MYLKKMDALVKLSQEIAVQRYSVTEFSRTLIFINKKGALYADSYVFFMLFSPQVHLLQHQDIVVQHLYHLLFLVVALAGR